MLPYESSHQFDTTVILQQLDRDTPGLKELLFTHEVPVLANDDPRDPVQYDSSAAHRTGRQSGDHGALSIDGRVLSPGVFQRGHFRVQNRASSLHPLVMASPDDAAIVYEYRSDGDPALLETRFSLADSLVYELLGHGVYDAKALIRRLVCRFYDSLKKGAGLF